MKRIFTGTGITPKNKTNNLNYSFIGRNINSEITQIDFGNTLAIHIQSMFCIKYLINMQLDDNSNILVYLGITVGTDLS